MAIIRSPGMGDVRVRQGWFLQNKMVHSGFTHILCLDLWLFPDPS